WLERGGPGDLLEGFERARRLLAETGVDERPESACDRIQRLLRVGQDGRPEARLLVAAVARERPELAGLGAPAQVEEARKEAEAALAALLERPVQDHPAIPRYLATLAFAGDPVARELIARGRLEVPPVDPRDLL